MALIYRPLPISGEQYCSPNYRSTQTLVIRSFSLCCHLPLRFSKYYLAVLPVLFIRHHMKVSPSHMLSYTTRVRHTYNNQYRHNYTRNVAHHNSFVLLPRAWSRRATRCIGHYPQFSVMSSLSRFILLCTGYTQFQKLSNGSVCPHLLKAAFGARLYMCIQDQYSAQVCHAI